MVGAGPFSRRDAVLCGREPRDDRLYLHDHRRPRASQERRLLHRPGRDGPTGRVNRTPEGSGTLCTATSTRGASASGNSRTAPRFGPRRGHRDPARRVPRTLVTTTCRAPSSSRATPSISGPGRERGRGRNPARHAVTDRPDEGIDVRTSGTPGESNCRRQDVVLALRASSVGWGTLEA
jgi:hypothetical protein